MIQIYRYTVDFYNVPLTKIHKDGTLIKCTMDDIKRDYPVYKHEFLSKNYDPQAALSSNLLPDSEGFKWVADKTSRALLDEYDKNLEFCERAELAFDGLDGKYADPWDYMYWVVDNLIREEFEETLKAIKERNLEQLIDGAADIQVLASNLPYKALRKLLKQQPAQARRNTRKAFGLVVDSNLRKLDGKYSAEFRHDGKVLKPTGWTAPNFDEIINEEVE